jgi:hypothetical protein
MGFIEDRKGLASKTYFIIVLMTLLLFIMVTGYFNQTLFILYGYDLRLLNSSSVESFEAYRKIGKIKLPILTALVILSAASFIWTLKSTDNLNKWIYRIFFAAFAVITILAIVFIFFYFIVPSNILQ